jgi:hypothetical protein
VHNAEHLFNLRWYFCWIVRDVDEQVAQNSMQLLLHGVAFTAIALSIQSEAGF